MVSYKKLEETPLKLGALSFRRTGFGMKFRRAFKRSVCFRVFKWLRSSLKSVRHDVRERLTAIGSDARTLLDSVSDRSWTRSTERRGERVEHPRFRCNREPVPSAARNSTRPASGLPLISDIMEPTSRRSKADNHSCRLGRLAVTLSVPNFDQSNPKRARYLRRRSASLALLRLARETENKVRPASDSDRLA